jgi:HSP20 family protein
MADITVRREPMRPLSPLGAGSLFDLLGEGMRFGSLFDMWDERAFPVDVSKLKGELIIRASLPGYEADDIDVEIANGVLTIRAQIDEEHEERGEHYYRRERSAGFKSRKVELPEAIAENDVKAEFRGGVLTLTAPVAAGAKQIEVKAA